MLQHGGQRGEKPHSSNEICKEGIISQLHACKLKNQFIYWLDRCQKGK
jgi:hypothetical protein